MKIHRTYKFRIYPTPEQQARLVDWQNALRFLWNLANEQYLMGQSRPRDERIYPSAYGQSREITELRARLPWLADVPRGCCETVLLRLEKAWRLCFRRAARSPRWKRKGIDDVSMRLTHAADWSLSTAGLRLSKLGLVSVKQHRLPLGIAGACTVRREGDQWFASLDYEREIVDTAPRAEPVVAIDRGITYTLADSDGNLTPNPKHYEQAMKRLGHAQRVVSRRKKGSKNREKAKLRVMRLNRMVRRQREHFLHVESSRLAKSHGVVVIEKLNVSGMARGNCSRGIAGAGWSAFAAMLSYKLPVTGGSLVAVPAQYSSQTCAVCGRRDAVSRRGEVFACRCGNRDHADLNAAKVILSRASRAALPVEGSMLKVSR
jgi:putative transposase